MVMSCAISPSRHGHGIREHARARRIIYHDVVDIQFLQTGWSARLRVEAQVATAVKNAGCVVCDITDENGKPIAKAASTCVVLRGEQARTR
jgi:hypothetical protein